MEFHGWSLISDIFCFLNFDVLTWLNLTLTFENNKPLQDIALISIAN